MARVFRQQYTRPIPPDAQRVTIHNKKGESVPAVRFKGADGKSVTAPVTAKGKNAGKLCRVASPNWYGRVDGEPVSLCTNKTAAEQMLAELVKKAEMGKAGMRDPFEQHRKRPLVEHLAGFHQDKLDKGHSAKQADQCKSRCEAVFDGCGFALLGDLDAEAAEHWLAERRQLRRKEGGFGVQTSNHYVAALKSFGNWCVARSAPVGQPVRAAGQAQRGSGRAPCPPRTGRRRVCCRTGCDSPRGALLRPVWP